MKFIATACLFLLLSCGQPQISDVQQVGMEGGNQASAEQNPSSYSLVYVGAGWCKNCKPLVEKLVVAKVLKDSHNPYSLNGSYAAFQIEQCYSPEVNESYCDDSAGVCKLTTEKHKTETATKCAEVLKQYVSFAAPGVTDLELPFMMIYSPSNKKVITSTIALKKSGVTDYAGEFKKQLDQILQGKPDTETKRVSNNTGALPDAKVDLKPSMTNPNKSSQTSSVDKVPQSATQQQRAPNRDQPSNDSQPDSSGGDSKWPGILQIFGQILGAIIT